MKVTKCRLCKTGFLDSPVLDFGKTPLANEFLPIVQDQKLFDLQVCSCLQCGHYQLNESIEPECLFRDYVFVAGTSATNVEHFRQYAVHMQKTFGLTKSSKVLDIASNDGTLLKHFQDLGMQVLGIDPAINIAAIANEAGIETIPEFFTAEYAQDMLDTYGKFDLITANNVFAHVPDLDNFARGVKILLNQQGTFSFEVSYFSDVCNKNLFDTIYHEHSSYHTIEPLISFFQSHDMTLFNVDYISNHGGSIRVYVCHAGNLKSTFQVPDKDKIEHVISKLREDIIRLGFNLRKRLSELKSDNKSIAIYGTPAKATTLMYALDIDEHLIDFAVDDNPLKQNTFTPGKHIPVLSKQEIYIKKPDYLLILAWNFAESIIEQHPNFGGTWIIPIPELKEICG